jgi:hypothetical protein
MICTIKGIRFNHSSTISIKKLDIQWIIQPFRMIRIIKNIFKESIISLNKIVWYQRKEAKDKLVIKVVLLIKIQEWKIVP